MIEAAKELLEMVKHMPQYALWVLIGLLFYKVVIIGSWFGIARLLINKTYSYLTRPPHPPHPVQMQLGRFLVQGVNVEDILGVFINAKAAMSKHDESLNYIHLQHVEYIHKLINEDRERKRKLAAEMGTVKA